MTRTLLPTRRACWTQAARVGGLRVYVSCGEDADGTLREVFVRVARTGSAMHATLDTLAVLTSLALQHGAPVSTITRALRGVDFQPSGLVTDHPTVTEARSLIDYIAAHLDASYGPDGKRVAT